MNKVAISFLVLLSVSLMSCAKPKDGVPGALGPQGQSGVPGTGGTNGAPGTSVTAVQFCKTQTTHYPDVFPETGLCIGGDIYAVYWDRSNLNGWLTKITPGTYTSTATNLSCTFTVHANCVVTN